MSDYYEKFQAYKNALDRLIEGTYRYDENDDLLRDGLIQRFEFTFELAWKTLKSIFEDEGLSGLNSPKTVLREAFAAQIITDDELWLNMLNDRNLTAHIYSEELAIKICSNIKNKYVKELLMLVEKIEKRISK
ncbi:MAG: nucleotidyltransferase substrate binding protein [Peptococcales bacterium]|jgi:nucleotidyltransferase substrate binding protein (TIGR01987 family)